MAYADECSVQSEGTIGSYPKFYELDFAELELRPPSPIIYQNNNNSKQSVKTNNYIGMTGTDNYIGMTGTDNYIGMTGTDNYIEMIGTNKLTDIQALAEAS